MLARLSDDFKSLVFAEENLNTKDVVKKLTHARCEIWYFSKFNHIIVQARIKNWAAMN